MLDRLRHHGLPVLAVVAIWWLIVAVTDVKPYLLPSPAEVARAGYDHWRELAGACGFTIRMALTGLAISFVMGLPLAMVLDASEPLRRTFYPPLVATQVVPVVVFAPILVMWFGFSSAPEIIVVVIMTIFPIVIETMAGLAMTTRDRMELAQTMGAGPLKTFIKVKAPGALPSIFNGLKIAVTSSLVGALVAEFVSSSRGLGSLFLNAINVLDNPLLFAGAIVVSVAGVLLFGIVEWSERMLIPWDVSRRTKLAWGS